MAEQDCASLCEIGAVEAQQWQKCSFCPGFACSFNHQIFTQRLREPYVLARELRKEGEGKGFCLLLADEKEAGQGNLLWGLPRNWGLPWDLWLFCDEENALSVCAGGSWRAQSHCGPLGSLVNWMRWDSCIQQEKSANHYSEDVKQGPSTW